MSDRESTMNDGREETAETSDAGNSSAGPSTSMGPPQTYPCQEPGCVKQYSRCQVLLGH